LFYAPNSSVHVFVVGVVLWGLFIVAVAVFYFGVGFFVIFGMLGWVVAEFFDMYV